MTNITQASDELQTLAERLRIFAKERNWEQFHSPKNLVMALAGEAGELLEQFQWLTESESSLSEASAEKRQAVAHELADVFLYLVRISDRLDIDLLQAANEKILVNQQKYPIDACYGSHAKYSDLAKEAKLSK
ncbi:MAG: nucleotide pyrophosphohydrolase [Kangiellaceae bacterium]|nr:nucleotide pyrophosphohydrolase [Kangiellaceae bacterium]|tara:strand:- start:15141 stop:15539 length:399 start_codon:yes stop_codon:yes gene_type:complete